MNNPDDVKRYPINETFGPTIQGEGPMIGRRTFFVRFAGCDYDCSWCDTKYAVNPKYPGWVKRMKTASEIAHSLRELGAVREDVITLSGGNPALFLDEELSDILRNEGFYLAMETQGSAVMAGRVLELLDVLVFSPKPPSSGMSGRVDPKVIAEMLRYHFGNTGVDSTACVKIVIFDDRDFEWAQWFRGQIIALLGKETADFFPWYMSVGTVNAEMPTNASEALQLTMHRERICEGAKWLMEKVMQMKDQKDWRVLPQLHSLAWGNKKGV